MAVDGTTLHPFAQFRKKKNQQVIFDYSFHPLLLKASPSPVFHLHHASEICPLLSTSGTTSSDQTTSLSRGTLSAYLSHIRSIRIPQPKSSPCYSYTSTEQLLIARGIIFKPISTACEAACLPQRLLLSPPESLASSPSLELAETTPTLACAFV